MINYSSFISYLRQELDSTDHKELNGVETIIEYFKDYPPEVLEGVSEDSDYFREEIEKLAEDNIFEIQEKLREREYAWIKVDSGKWISNVAKDTERKEDQGLTSRLSLVEKKILELSISDIDSTVRKDLLHLYRHKVKKYGTDVEIYSASKLLADSYKYVVDSDGDYVDSMSEAGRLGRELKDSNSYNYYELAAKYYRNKYEYEESAKYFKDAVTTAKECGETDETILSLTKKMRIQYELCSDEENAVEAYIEENNLIAKISNQFGIKVIYSILGGVSDFCQNPRKVASWALFFIFVCTVLYSFLGITKGGVEQTVLNYSTCWTSVLWDSFYFSVVTFSTLGYGDFSPSEGFSRFIAMIEALGGLFFTSLFLATLVRRYGR